MQHGADPLVVLMLLSAVTGDGMTHAVRIKGGRASYANRYVETHRLQTEKAAGFPIYEKVPQWCLHIMSAE